MNAEVLELVEAKALVELEVSVRADPQVCQVVGDVHFSCGFSNVISV